MKYLVLPVICLAGWGLFVAVFAQEPKATPGSEYPTPTVREQQTVVVDGVSEIWRLQWMTAPAPACGPRDDSALICPCAGFAYGEAGALDLVRLRNGAEIDRLPLAPLFAGGQTPAEGAVIPRWEVDYDKDSKDSKRQDFPLLVNKRPTLQVMRFGDYDHTGWKNEFYLQFESFPCAHQSGFVVGVSKGNPRLHVLGTASSPDQPLYLRYSEWEALRAASGPIEVMDWPCGDHGADDETTVRLAWTAKGITGSRRHYTCDNDHRLIEEEPI